ncbi:msrA [Symbiodinium sp. CCMP2456]|nr:msrA [Symbiodinium sp. CCMP2456]
MADLQRQLGTQTQKVKILQAELEELKQVVLGLTQVEEEEGEHSEETGTPPPPSADELEELTDSDTDPLPPPPPSLIARILLQQVFTCVAGKNETAAHVQKSHADDTRIKEADPAVEVERGQQTTMQSGPAVEVEEPHTTRWVCVRRSGMDIRSGPYVQRTHVAGYLPAQKVFDVCEERRGLHGTVFLKLADGSGWVFSETRSGIFCEPADARHKKMEGEKHGHAWTYQGQESFPWKGSHENSWSGSSDSENRWWTAQDTVNNGSWNRSWSGSADSKSSEWWMEKGQGEWKRNDPWANWKKNQY